MSLSHSSLLDDFEITTALRSDQLLTDLPCNDTYLDSSRKSSQFYMLSRHRDRMLAATETFHWPEDARRQISNLEQTIHTHLDRTYGNVSVPEPLKVRVTLSSNGTMNATSEHIKATSPSSLFPNDLSDLFRPVSTGHTATFRVIITIIPTVPNEFTKHKTTKRAQYDKIRSKILPLPRHNVREIDPLPEEVLLVNHADEIMEGSITTTFFYRNGQWITPSAACGGNLGTTRQFALDTGLCQEGIVMRNSARVGERVVLSNGVRGFGWGVIEDLEAR